MKKKTAFLSAVLLMPLAFSWVGCSSVYTTPSSYMPTPTSTTVPSAPVTLTITIGSGGTGFQYQTTGVPNGGNGALSLTAHVGDSIVLPGGSIHPLYFDGGSSTCIYTGSTNAAQTYTFPSAGTYYFHCGNHATSCSAGNSACGSTNCAGMAGSVVVSP